MKNSHLRHIRSPCIRVKLWIDSKTAHPNHRTQINWSYSKATKFARQVSTGIEPGNTYVQSIKSAGSSTLVERLSGPPEIWTIDKHNILVITKGTFFPPRIEDLFPSPVWDRITTGGITELRGTEIDSKSCRSSICEKFDLEWNSQLSGRLIFVVQRPWIAIRNRVMH